MGEITDVVALKRAARTRKAAALRLREGEALELRKAGYTYQRIADTVGYRHPSDAQRAMTRCLARLTQPAAAELRALENERLDHLQRGQWEQAASGSGEAVITVLKIMQRRAALNGLDAPQKQAVTNAAGDDLVDLERLRALFFLATGEPADEAHELGRARR